MHETQAQTIRRLVRQTFQGLGSRSTAPLRETLLIRDGNYCGHRFELGALQAVWFIEENQLKFYGPGGSIIQAVRPFGSQDEGLYKAA
jgi:hypothetical protein